MTDILAMHAAATPDKLAVVTDAGETRTYAQLNARTIRVASMLQRLGMQRGDRSVQMAYNSVHGPEIGHALRKLFCVSTPMNYRLRGAEIVYLLNDSGARVVFAGPEFVPHIEAARAQVEDADRRTFIAVIGDD